ncbi:putative malate transporter YflS [invertebrate metagenome]|uniref:Putative malate transporter YflS n=1 Tax=invertebrate metagenome TaxID=1711999 RepID=A0A2H9T3S8_9ZZZZ
MHRPTVGSDRTTKHIFTRLNNNPLISARIVPLAFILLASAVLWFIAPPEGLSIAAYHTAILFIAMIASIVANVMPTGVVAIIGTAVYALLRVGGEETAKAAIETAMKNFNNLLIWMIVIAFTIARSFVKTGLGRRIALILLSHFGKSSLRIAYCLGVADYLIAPVTPSNTARAAIISPIAESLIKVINKDDRKLGQFLISNTSAMNDASAVGFMTGFAGNLALVSIAASVAGITLSFSGWLLYLFIPSFALLLTVPWILYRFINPETRNTPQAPEYAREQLRKMGAITLPEKKLLFVFMLLLVMWVGGDLLGIHSTTAAFAGLGLLLLSGVLSWDDVKGEKGAWDTLVWFSVLMGMANLLKAYGFTGWVGSGVSDFISTYFAGAGWIVLLAAMMLFYLLTSYFFASGTAKVVALAPVLIGALVNLGISPTLSVLAIAGITNIGCNLTTYSHARNPLLLGYGYHTDKEWMKIGIIIAVVGFMVFLPTGLIWWNIVGV